MRLCRTAAFGYASRMVVRRGRFPGGSLSRWLVLPAALAQLAIGASLGVAQTSLTQPSLGLQEQPSQQGAPQPSQSAPATQPSPAPSENPGLLNEMGKMFDKLLPPLKSPSETIDDLNTRAKETAKGAGEALSRLAPGSMVRGRMICPVGANGTPDCKLGADKLCQSNGYKDGRSLNTDSRETCSAKVLIPGRQRKPDDCRTDNYVTSALCQ
jgi:hypothetical protein